MSTQGGNSRPASRFRWLNLESPLITRAALRRCQLVSRPLGGIVPPRFAPLIRQRVKLDLAIEQFTIE